MTDPEENAGGRPLFSVAIPAYKEKTLLGRALFSILTQTVSDLEIIVSDDSDSAEIRALLKAIDDPRVRYVRRPPPPGAVANWNFCLGECRGRYVVLLHHDECFADADCLRQIERVFRDKKAQIVASSVLIETPSRGVRLLPGGRVLRRIFASLSPRLFLAYNAVGPVSVLALDREAASTRFDERLRWLVDAEYYSRLFAGRRMRSCPRSRVLSHVAHEHRITQGMDLEEEETRERRALLSREPARPGRAALRLGWALHDSLRWLKRWLKRRL